MRIVDIEVFFHKSVIRCIRMLIANENFTPTNWKSVEIDQRKLAKKNTLWNLNDF